MQDFIKRTWIEINLDNIAHNAQQIKKITSKDTKIMAVIKADAYGHGALKISETLLESGIEQLAVAFLEEAKQLRNHGIDAPILILGYTQEEYAKDLVDLNITQTVFNYSLANAISNVAVTRNKKANIHIKIDTGMTRLGFKYPHNGKDTIKEIMNISKLPGINIEGIFTHFVSADDDNEDFTNQQFKEFIHICNELEKNGIYIPVKHICNSAGIIEFPQMHLDMVRAGIILYGLYPSNNVNKEKIELKPAMELKAIITNLNNIPKGETVGYGRNFTATKKTKVATIPIGYADGFSRMLSNKVNMIVGNSVVPVIGNICMDQCMIDITGINNINIGDEVIVFGKKGSQSISIEDIAVKMGTINYELLCLIGKRVLKVYIKNDKTIGVFNYLS